MFGPGFRGFVSQEQSQSSKILKKSDSGDSGAEEGSEILGQEEIKEHSHSEDSGNCSEAEGEFEVLDGKSQEIPANPCDALPEDLSLESAILANFPDGCDRSLTVELKDEVSFDIISKSLTFAEITHILNQAIQEDNCEELDKVVQNIEDYEGRSIMLDNVNLKSFCEQQLNLDLQDRSDHQHIYSNVLSQYKFDQEEFKYDYSVKELVLLAIAANDKLTERYQDILFIEENLSLLPLFVGGQEYVKAFIGRFHDTDGIYGRLKDQTIQLVEPNKIGFFSVIALRKEQELLNAVFVEYVLRDFGQVLKTSNPDSLYGVLETASLIKNKEFITIVLDTFERYINELTKKASTEELLKKSFATLLETAISQEHISVVEYLCKRYTNSTDHAIYDVYEQAFADDKVITILRQQILKNIGARGRKEIYDLILKTALDAGNIAFIEHLCKECAECSNDVINYLDHKSKNNEFDEIYESILVALSNVENTNTNAIAKVLFYTEKIYQNASHNEQVIRQVIQNILRNATHYSTGQEDYSLIKEVCYLCTEIDAINIIFQEECKIFKSSIEKRIEDLETDLIFSLMQIRNILQFSIDVQEYPCHRRQDLWDEMYQIPGTFIIRKRSNNVADELEIPVIKSDILSENPEFESAGSKQVEKNILAGEEENAILNNTGVSITGPISNNFEEGKMGKNSNKKRQERVKQSKEEKKKNEQKKEEQLRETYIGNNNSSQVTTEEDDKNDATAPLVDIGKKEQTPVQSAEHVPEESAKLKAQPSNTQEQQEVSETPVPEQTDDIESLSTQDALVLQSGSLNPIIEMGNTQNLQSAVLSSQQLAFRNVIETFNKHGREGFTSLKLVVQEFLRNGISEIQLPISNGYITLNLNTINKAGSEGLQNIVKVLTDSYKNGALNDRTRNAIETHDDIDDYRLFSEKDPTLTPTPAPTPGLTPDLTQDPILTPTLVPTPNPVPTPEPVPSVANNKSEQVNDIQTNGGLPNNSGKNNAIPQNTKSSKLPVIAASALAIAGIISGVAVAVYLEMLAVGIAVGACCLVAATIIYYCTPKSQVENNEVEKSFNTGKVPTAVHV